MIEFFADLHIHVGRTSAGHPVKIAASKSLTIQGILSEALERKGLQMIGIVDCASPPVLDELSELIDNESLKPLPGGGLRYKERLTVILGVELGADLHGKEAHYLSYLPTIDMARRFSTKVGSFVTNIQLSSQKTRLTPRQLLQMTHAHKGFFVLAHAFAPHKGYYGNCSSTLADAFKADDIASIAAIELGLSADTSMASRVSELDGKSFLSNSDAHSLPKIAREYNAVQAERCDFDGLLSALTRRPGGIKTNFGLQPRLGKYYRTVCNRCHQRIDLMPDRRCPICQDRRITVGVADRMSEIADRLPQQMHHPPYVHQVPLEFIPGIGPKTRVKLLHLFGNEMNVLHHADEAELRAILPVQATQMIIDSRRGQVTVNEGGGGTYGRLT